MGDTDMVPYGGNLADPTIEVHRLLIDEQIAEKKYQLARVKADLEKFQNGTIKKMKAAEIMLEREVAALIMKKDTLEGFGSHEVIDITNITKQGGPNG